MTSVLLSGAMHREHRLRSLFMGSWGTTHLTTKFPTQKTKEHI